MDNTSSLVSWTDFHALEEVCGLDVDTLGRFKDRFQFPE